jgi:hypothetical protein
VDQELAERARADGSPVGKDQSSGHQALNGAVGRPESNAEHLGHGLVPVLGSQRQVERHSKVEWAK